MGLVDSFTGLLIPRLGTKDVVNVLDLLVPPDGGMHILPAQRLQRIVDVWQGDPSTLKEVGKQRLISEFVIFDRGWCFHSLKDGGV